MRNRTQHGLSRLTAISDAGSTPAASTSLRTLRGPGLGMPFLLSMPLRLGTPELSILAKISKVRGSGLRLNMPLRAGCQEFYSALCLCRLRGLGAGRGTSSLLASAWRFDFWRKVSGGVVAP